ncbi:hypothetical protein GCM10010387_40170 [Streptomyces inusitatus]|uniref:Uncharacterized protein n=1 Tax=Streptomyces inusitatus TaxID=68221 RepID=A0A918QEK1_9ACTN|nr:hypothetical protein GCM10010387_40170 [Streptomyces inusitatus]
MGSRFRMSARPASILVSRFRERGAHPPAGATVARTSRCLTFVMSAPLMCFLRYIPLGCQVVLTDHLAGPHLGAGQQTSSPGQSIARR